MAVSHSLDFVSQITLFLREMFLIYYFYISMRHLARIRDQTALMYSDEILAESQSGHRNLCVL